MTRRLTILAFPLAVLAFAAPAGAATVSSEGTLVTISAPGREINRIAVSARSTGGVTITDSRTPVAVGAGCTQIRSNRARCGGPETTALIADAGPFGDSLSVGQSVRFRVELRGGSGNDTLRGGSAGDLLIGGSGRDAVTYSGRPGDVTVTLGGGADDGAPGEGDEVLEVERAFGGRGFDTIIGTPGGDGLYGGPGDDRLDGAGGNDVLTGNSGLDLLQGGDGNDVFLADRAPDGADVAHGGPGVDRADYARRGGAIVVDPDGFADDGDRPGETLSFTGPLPSRLTYTSPERDNVMPDVESVRGGAGADVLSTSASGGFAEGGPGTDVLLGGPGVDAFSGGAGFDRIVSRDRVPEEVRCGTESDRVFGDGVDRVDVDCELRAVAFQVGLSAAAQQLGGEGLRVRVECPAQAFDRCVGNVRARTLRRVRTTPGAPARQADLGLAGFQLVPGTADDVVIPLGREERELVARLAPLRLTIAARARDGAGPARLSTTTLVLRP